MCGGLFEFTMEPEIRATTCISVLRVSRRGRVELRTYDNVCGQIERCSRR